MLIRSIIHLRHRLASKLIFIVGATLLITIASWSYFNMKYQKKTLIDNVVASTDRLTTTIRLGTHYAMMINSRDDINQIINNIAKVRGIQNIRIYNKEGQIKFSNRPAEVDTRTNIRAEACYICHRTEPPQVDIGMEERTRIFASREGYRLLGIISPIGNEPGCSSDACHVHPEGKKILGALDVVVSLEDIDHEIRLAETAAIGFTGVVFMIPSAIIFLFVLRFVNRPVRKLIAETHLIGQGLLPSRIDLGQDDEMGQLASAINQMSAEIAHKQTELNKQRDEYQTLVERVPCLITVQDRNLRLLSSNGEFRRRFGPNPGEYCYHAYKGRDEKCSDCPVEKTFLDGQPHQGEETGSNRDGSKVHWMFKTSPIKNTEGRIVAVLEMSLDITERRELEEKLKKSELKYHEIFNQIPNPVFVVDHDSLEVLDCNKSVTAVYGLSREDIIGRSFLDLFLPGADLQVQVPVLQFESRPTAVAGDAAEFVSRLISLVNPPVAPAKLPDVLIVVLESKLAQGILQCPLVLAHRHFALEHIGLCQSQPPAPSEPTVDGVGQKSNPYHDRRDAHQIDLQEEPNESSGYQQGRSQEHGPHQRLLRTDRFQVILQMRLLDSETFALRPDLRDLSPPVFGIDERGEFPQLLVHVFQFRPQFSGSSEAVILSLARFHLRFQLLQPLGLVQKGLCERKSSLYPGQLLFD